MEMKVKALRKSNLKRKLKHHMNLNEKTDQRDKGTVKNIKMYPFRDTVPEWSQQNSKEIPFSPVPKPEQHKPRLTMTL